MDDEWAERARMRMGALALSQDDLRDALGVGTRGAVGHYLNGRRQLSAVQAVGLAKRLKCDIAWLLTGELPVSEPRSRVPNPQALLHYLSALPPDQYAAVARLVVALAAEKR